jgi:hypothetical protein
MESTKILSLPTNDKKIYRQILAFMNFILKITTQELEVLAEIIKLNNEYEALPNPKRAKFILSTDMRKEMREYLEIEEKQFNGVIFKLKSKMYLGSTILDTDGVLNKNLVFKPSSDGFKIEVNLIRTDVSTPAVESIVSKEEPLTNTPIIPVIENLATEEKDFHDMSKVAPMEDYDIDFTIDEPSRGNN